MRGLFIFIIIYVVLCYYYIILYYIILYYIIYYIILYYIILYYIILYYIFRGFKTSGDAFRLPHSNVNLVTRLWYMVLSSKTFLLVLECWSKASTPKLEDQLQLWLLQFLAHFIFFEFIACHNTT